MGEIAMSRRGLKRRAAPELLEQDFQSALKTWMESISNHTQRSYLTGLRQFGEYLHERGFIDDPGIEDAGRFLLSQDAQRASMIVQAWLESLARVDPETQLPRYTTTTINMRMAALRWAVKQARRAGHIAWTLEIDRPRVKKHAKTGRLLKKPGRDMRGPPIDKIREMFELARADEDPRSELILSLCFCETLRCSEVVALNYEDFDLRSKRFRAIRKKREEEEVLPLSEPTVVAFKRLVETRGRKPGALIYSGTNSKRNRISLNGVAYKVSKLGEKVGIQTTPHRIRHSGITMGDLVRQRLGMTKQQAKKRAGHVSDSAHDVYLDVDLSDVRRITDGVASLL